MALPEDVTTFELTFGPYTDASGEPVLVGTKGKIKPSVSPIRHTASGSVVIDSPIPVEIDEFGVASVELAHTAQAVLSPDAFTYSVTWDVASRKPSPGNKQISVLPTDGAVIDFDLLGESEDVVGVHVPSALSVNGQTGVVVLDAADVGAATPADLAAGLATKQGTATLAADVAPHVTDGSALDVALRAASETSGAFRPTTRVPQAKYTMVSAFQSGHGWTAQGGTAGFTATDDTTMGPLGTQSLKVSVPASGNGTVRAAARAAVNLSAKNFALLLTVDQPVNLNDIILTLGESGYTNFSQLRAVAGGLPPNATPLMPGVPTWVHFTWSAQTVAGGTPTRTAVTDYQLRVNAASGGPVNVWLSGLAWFTPPPAFPNGVLTFTADDSFASQYTKLRPILDGYGWGADAYLIVDKVDTAGNMTMAQLHELEDLHGWAVCAHSLTAADHATGFTGLTADQLDLNLRAMKAWLTQHGFRGKDLLAHPKGMYNATVNAAVAKYYSAARTTTQKPYQPVLTENRGLMTRAVQLGGVNTTVADITALIDQAYTNGFWLNLVVHNVIDSGTVDGNNYLTADLAAIAAYANTKGIPVKTTLEVLSATADLGVATETAPTTRAASVAPRVPRPRPAKLSPLSLFQAGHGWTGSTGTWTLNDTTRPIIGTQHLSVTTSTRGTIAAADKTIAATNLTGKQVALLVWVSDATALETIQAYLGDSTLANNKHWSMAAGSASEWICTVRSGAWMWIYTTDATSAVDGTGDLSAATRLRLRVTPRTEGVPVTVSVQEIAVFDKPTAYPNGVLTFSFDDSDTTQTKAEAILAANGFRASMYTIVDRIGQAGSLSMADLVRQHDTLGWEICGHAYTSANHDAKYPTLPDAVVEEDMRRCKEWLVTNGFRGADHFAWPGGQDSNALAPIARKYWATGRGLCVTGGAIRNEVMSPEAGDMPLRMRASTPDSSTAPSVTTALIDKAYSSGGWLILGYHQLVDTIPTASSVKYLTTDFQAVVDYAATKGIAVAGISEVLRTSGVI